MINIFFGKLVYDKSGKSHLVDRKRLMKIPVTFDFGFNIYEPDNWKVWLSGYTDKSGKKLPRFTKHGDEIGYIVRVIGVTKEMKSDLGIGKVRRPIFDLFPGYSDEEYSVRYGYERGKLS